MKVFFNLILSKIHQILKVYKIFLKSYQSLSNTINYYLQYRTYTTITKT